jgi:hypothetical protein
MSPRTELNRHAEKCPKHGLHYDPRSGRGCVFCQRDKPVQTDKGLGLGLKSLVPVVVGLVLVAVVILLTGGATEQEASGSNSVQTAAPTAPTPPATPTAPPPSAMVPRHAVNKLLDAAGAIEDLVRDGEAETASFPDPTGDPGLVDSDLAQSWGAWTDRWLRRVNETFLLMPPSTVIQSDETLTRAHQEIESALNTLRLLPFSDSGLAIPSEQERQDRFNFAAAAAVAARAHLRTL